jgi:hypothetical protein
MNYKIRHRAQGSVTVSASACCGSFYFDLMNSSTSISACLRSDLVLLYTYLSMGYTKSHDCQLLVCKTRIQTVLIF